MEEKVEAVYTYVMERCLWQFFSRNWDREDNINTIMANVAKIQSGQEVDRSTNILNSHYTNAKILTEQLAQRFPWFSSLGAGDIAPICDRVREKLINIAVVNSLNAERTEVNY